MTRITTDLSVYEAAEVANEPLIASGAATPLGEVVATRYREVVDLIKALEDEKAYLRERILQDAEIENPAAKSFPAGDLIIRISTTTRETVAVAKVRSQFPDLYEALTAAGVVTKTTSKALSVR